MQMNPLHGSSIEHLDQEWYQLIDTARKMGISKTEVGTFIHETAAAVRKINNDENKRS